MEHAAAASAAVAFARRDPRLAELRPLAAAARPGPAREAVILVNNALAWGGVERQIVYTLAGLAARGGASAKAPPPSLLCLRLGIDADHDFYLPQLAGAGLSARNAMPDAQARDALAGWLEPGERDRVEGCIGWLPADVKAEIWRLAAEFLAARPRVVHAWQDGLSISAGYAARRRRAARHHRRAQHRAGAFRLPPPLHARRLWRAGGLRGPGDAEQQRGGRGLLRRLARPRPWTLHGAQERHRRRADPGGGPRGAARPAQGLGVPPDAPLVGSIFRFYAEKRPLLWIEAAARAAKALPDAHFVVFGTGPMREQMLARAAALGFAKRLHLPGTTDAPGAALSAMDVFMLASGMEGTPNVVLEASLIGLPIVATDAGGTAETIDEGVTGFVVPQDDAALLGDRVTQVLRDPLLPQPRRRGRARLHPRPLRAGAHDRGDGRALRGRRGRGGGGSRARRRGP